MEAEEQPMSSMQVYSWEPPGLLPPSSPAASSLTIRNISADFRQMILTGITSLSSAAPSPAELHTHPEAPADLIQGKKALLI